MEGLPKRAKESPLRDMYRRWQATKAEYNSMMDDDDDGPLFQHMLALEGEAAAFEPQTVEDYAFKIIFTDDNGDMSMNSAQHALVAMACQIAGIPIARRVKFAL